MKIRIRFLGYDILIQSIWLLINLTLLVYSLFVYGGIIYLALFQILLGAYQLLFSALIHLGTDSFAPLLTRFRRVHFMGSIFYLFLIFSIASHLAPFLQVVSFFVIPQIVAHAYYGITWLDYLSKKRYLERRPTILAY